MLAGILIGIFIGAPIGMIIAALLRASGEILEFVREKNN